MIRLPHVVHVQRRVEREFLVGVDIDHGPLAERALEPDANGPVDVLAAVWHRLLVIVVVMVVGALVFIVGAAEEYSNVNLVVTLVHDDLAHAIVVAAERDAELEFADVPFSEAERMP
ncbi:MAG: hypothetical protein JO304_18490 [Solirubrobacterales bacterium]|nr:hypothetical protein [Solirubrobacterales bacterium]